VTGPATGLRGIAVVIGRGHARAGSTRLRGEQLAQLCAEAAAGSGHAVSLRYHDETLRNMLAIIHKTVLLPPYRDTLTRLHQDGCRLLVDFLDTMVRPVLARHADAFIACSRPQAEHLRQDYPDRPVVELPHHADLDVAYAAAPFDTWRCGYFGDPRNAAQLDALVTAGLVTAWATPVRNENGWREALADCNLHYAVRRGGLPEERFKPFTKGMLAARVGAVAVISAEDEEALRLLGPDYPFVMPAGIGPRKMVAQMQRLKESFGDARWALARSRMAPLREIGSAAHQVALLKDALFGGGPIAGWLR